MDSRKYLTERIRECRRKMNLAGAIDSGVRCAAAGGVCGILCEVLSLILPFYRAHLAAALCFGIGLLAGLGYAAYRRADMGRAAGRLDSFGLKERMITAWEQIDSEEEFALLQREDARKHYDRIRGQIRIPLFPKEKNLYALLLAAGTVIALSFVPAPAREQAKLLHQVQEQVREEQKELDELLEALDRIDLESLTEEERARLQELAEAMALSREELGKADSWESLATALEKLDYKYGQAAQTLASLAMQTTGPEGAGIAVAEALAKAAANKGGTQTASSGSPGSGSDSQSSGGQNGDGSGDGQGSGSGDGSGNGDGQGDGSGDGQGDGDGQGSGSGSGSGDGAGNGDGQGDGSGDGQGSGSSSGSGNGGDGRGTGSSSAGHDYVSIPNDIGEDPSLTGDKTGDQDSEYYRRQNGLAWEGEHVDYNSVIGEYTDSAYEGIASGRYPSGMESVIRDYFESLNKRE
ncbi:MAG: hypothetical protein NC432_00710 [Roseburia sp.]|nr:hypothetical protein [Roseburia sp.]MCM1097336.1 hypothetical protein [Ruminococcus flavefaciens]